MKKILTWVAIALLIFLVITNPKGAANSVSNVGNVLYDAAQSVSVFVTNLI